MSGRSWQATRAHLDAECWGGPRQRPIPAFPHEGPVEDGEQLTPELVAWIRAEQKRAEEHEERMGAWTARRGRLARFAALFERMTPGEQALVRALVAALTPGGIPSSGAP